MKAKIKIGPLEIPQTIKWSYDKQIGEWYVNESSAWANDGFSITKEEKTYKLEHDRFGFIGDGFRRLSSAKACAELLRNG